MWWGNFFVSRGCWENLVIKMIAEFGWLEGRLFYLQAILVSSFLISIRLPMRWRWSRGCPGHGDQASLGAGAAAAGRDQEPGRGQQCWHFILTNLPLQVRKSFTQTASVCHAGFALVEFWRWACFLLPAISRGGKDFFPDFKKSDSVFFLARYN